MTLMAILDMVAMVVMVLPADGASLAGLLVSASLTA